MKVIHVVTVSQTLNFLSGQAGFLKSRGINLQAVSSPGSGVSVFSQREGVPVHAIPMTRSISPWRDLISFIRLVRLFSIEQPDIVHAHTPKASLLAMAAACVAGVRKRIFHLHGLPHSTAKGLPRFLLVLSTRIACLLATRILCVSESARSAAIADGLVKASAIRVPSAGGINGVDSRNTFDPLRPRATLRESISEDAVVIGFAGRLVRDKGICELAGAWSRLRDEFEDVHLFIAGEPEVRDAVPASVLDGLQSDSRVRLIGQVADMAAFYASIDMLVLPSYREGLPTVALEAAAMQLPVVTTDAVGCVDAVIHELTGMIVPVGDSNALENALRRYVKDPDLRQKHGQRARQYAIQNWNPEDVWQAMLNEYRSFHVTSRFKRSLDASVAAILLVAVSPILVFLAVLIRLFLGTPVLFRQQRPGFDGQLFTMYKFRTMRDAFDHYGEPLPDSDRLTRLGRFLRASSLDELPELWNVLKGDMSLVGPRPLLVEYLSRYTQFQKRRHEAKPGITGWAQVSGRNSLSWEEKFKLDVWYIDNQSLLLDLKILWRTVVTVFRREGIVQEGHVTMSKFLGSANQ